MADHSGREVLGIKFVCSLERWDRGFESQEFINLYREIGLGEGACTRFI
jgi:hypothetical protein